jgi:hypothetical protein
MVPVVLLMAVPLVAAMVAATVVLLVKARCVRAQVSPVKVAERQKQ